MRSYVTLNKKFLFVVAVVGSLKDKKKNEENET